MSEITPFDIKNSAKLMQRDFMMECADLMQSFSISLREAAFRGSDDTVVVTLKQMRLTLLEAISVGREMAIGSEAIPPAPVEASAPATP
jgi:hypothetical protein